MEVFVTQAVDPAALALLEEAGHRVRVRRGPRPCTRSELLEGVAGAAGLLCMLTERVDAEVFAAAPALRVVANHAVGYENLDLEAARARGIACTNTPGVLTAATADLAWALILAVARRVAEGDRLVRAGRWEGWHPLMLRGLELEGARLGIVGMGRIGRAVARRALAFGMEVVHHRGRAGGIPAAAVTLETLLETSDVVSLHCPLTPDTHHLLDEAALRRMKPGAVLVNTARGPVVDEAALVRVLRDGQLLGAGLDVFEAEPRVHPGLLDREDVVLLPHLGSATEATRRKMGRMAAENVVAVLAGEAPPNSVG